MDKKLGGFDVLSVRYTLDKILKDSIGTSDSIVDKILPVGGDKAKIFLMLVFVSKLCESFLERNYQERLKNNLTEKDVYDGLLLARSDYSYDILLGKDRNINIRSVYKSGGEVYCFESLLEVDKILARHKKMLDVHFDFIDIDTNGSTANNPIFESVYVNVFDITVQTTQYNFLYDDNIESNKYLDSVHKNYDVIMEKFQLLLDKKVKNGINRKTVRL